MLRKPCINESKEPIEPKGHSTRGEAKDSALLSSRDAGLLEGLIKQLTWKGGKALAHHMGLQELASPLGHCKNTGKAMITWLSGTDHVAERR